MAMKDFDFKQFLLHRGEWLGLGVAVAITLPLVFSSVGKLFSGSPTANAMEVDGLNQQARGRIQNSNPPPGADEVEKKLINSMLRFDPVIPDEFRTETPWFVRSAMEDTKRRNPEILAPKEFQTDVVRAGFRGTLLVKNGARLQVAVLRTKDSKTKQAGGNQGMGAGGGFQNRFRGMSGPGGRSGGMMPPGGGMAGPGGGDSGDAPGGMGGMGGMGGFGMGAAQGMRQPGQAMVIEMVDVDKLSDNRDVHLAEFVYPCRMVIVSGSFPLKDQLEEFRRKLRKRTMGELLTLLNNPTEARWEFKGIDVERRTFHLDGRLKSDWDKQFTDKMKTQFESLLSVALGVDIDDKEMSRYDGVINPGLVMAKPQLARDVSYPEVKLDSLKQAMVAIDKVGKDDTKRPLSALAQKFMNKGLDIFNPTNTYGNEEEKKPENMPQSPPTQSPNAPAGDGSNPQNVEPEQFIPDKALFRFIDVTAEAGFTYEYRFKVKMANPNFNQSKTVAYQSLAKVPVLVASDWTVVPKVTVPVETFWYAGEDRAERERAFVQIHRFVDWALTNPDNQQSRIGVGNWAIWDKAPVHRGEFVGRMHEAEVPVWNTERETFEIATNTKNRQKKLPIDFTVKRPNTQNAALVVDFDGGKSSQFRLGGKLVSDDVPVQVMVLTPEGKLTIRNTLEDSKDEVRKARFDAWKKEVEETRKGLRRGAQDDLFNNKNMPRGGGAGPGGGSGNGGS